MSQKEIRLAVENLEQFCIEVFVATGFSPQAARTQTDVLVWADLRGVESHGVMRIPRYVEWLRSGAMRADAVPEMANDLGAAGVVEAAQAPGAVAMSFAMSDAIKRARAHAIGWDARPAYNAFGGRRLLCGDGCTRPDDRYRLCD